MSHTSELKYPVSQLAAKLKAEIDAVEAKERELRIKQEILENEQRKIHWAEKQVKNEQTQLQRQRRELEYRLQEIRNEI